MKQQVAEEKIYLAAVMFEQAYGDLENSYQEALQRGRFFRETGLTPFYIYDDSDQSLLVTSHEAMNGRLN